jgi:hypothetical protein
VSVVDPFVGVVDRAIRFPVNALEYTNILLTTDDAVVGATQREVVWTHRQTTLYRYRSPDRRHAVPLLLVFALINRPEIFDLPRVLAGRVPDRGGVRRIRRRLGLSG